MGKIAGKIAPKTKDALSAEYERKSVYAPVIAVQITKSERERESEKERERKTTAAREQAVRVRWRHQVKQSQRRMNKYLEFK